jgi:hypothetical protein
MRSLVPLLAVAVMLLLGVGGAVYPLTPAAFGPDPSLPARSVLGLLYFVHEAVTVGGLGPGWFLGPLAVALVISLWRRPRVPETARRLPWLLLLVVPWIAAGLWCGWHWKTAEEIGRARPLLLIGWFLFWMRGARVVTASAALVNLYVTLVVISFGWMAVSGIWL